MRCCHSGIRVLVALVALSVAGVATAQERFGGLAGVVTDSSQAPVPGATITVTNKQTGAARAVVSGPDGALPDLRPRAWPLHRDRRAPGLPESRRRTTCSSCSDARRTFPPR